MSLLLALSLHFHLHFYLVFLSIKAFSNLSEFPLKQTPVVLRQNTSRKASLFTEKCWQNIYRAGFELAILLYVFWPRCMPWTTHGKIGYVKLRMRGTKNEYIPWWQTLQHEFCHYRWVENKATPSQKEEFTQIKNKKDVDITGWMILLDWVLYCSARSVFHV